MSNDYFVSIKLASEDFPSRAVSVTYDFSHDMTDRVLAGKDVPAAYAAASEIATLLRMAQSDQSFNYTDDELAAMSEEQREEAIAEAAATAAHSIVMPRIPRE